MDSRILGPLLACSGSVLNLLVLPLPHVFLSCCNDVQVDHELETGVYLDGIISVADAKHLPQHLRLGQEHSAQVLYLFCVSS